MAVIRREDGVQFVVQSYRELLTQKNPALLKNEIRFIGKTNGDYARLFKQRENQYEAVFSRDPGYLLGETVWYYFGKPADLIYCEALPDEQHAVVVIVRSGSIYLDAKLPLAGLQDEFISLATGNNRFAIYTSGDVPLVQNPEEDKFAFEPQLVQAFNVLNEPLFARLPVNDNLKLLSVDQAIKAQHLDKGLSPALLIAGILVAGLILYWIYPSKEQPAPQTIEARIEQVVEPSALQARQLQGPSPAQQLQKVADTINALHSLTGWQASILDFDGGSTLNVQMQSVGGRATMLLQWAKAQEARADLSSQGARIQFPVNLPGRAVAPPMMKEDEVSASIVDKMLQTLPGRSVQINSPASSGGLVEERLTVSFSNISPTTLVLIGKQVEGLPVKLTKCSVTNTDGLLSGQLELLVIGD
ncbi:MAG: hypothetical protein K0S11_1451 [Gammaproteobacteria bacterium]|jgi:hypothetical protein|nr:hypothetical protein [Gammaproteobacteria bacterium]